MKEQRHIHKSRRILERNGYFVTFYRKEAGANPISEKSKNKRIQKSIDLLEESGYFVTPYPAKTVVDQFLFVRSSRSLLRQVITSPLLAAPIVAVVSVVTFSAFLPSQYNVQPGPQSNQTTTAPTRVPFTQKIHQSDTNAIGISSIGLNPLQCQTLFPYQCSNSSGISTEELVGYAKINRINVTKDITGNNKYVMVGQHQASVQLNAYLNVADINYQTGTATNFNFFVQSVADINTPNLKTYFSDQIFSVYTSSSLYGPAKYSKFTLNNSNVIGNGSAWQNSYGYQTSQTQFHDGEGLYLVIKTGQIANQPVLQFGYALGGSSNQNISPTIFDTVKLNFGNNDGSPAGDPSIVIASSGITPNSSSNAEIVFAGPYSGEKAVFGNTFVSQMGLYYKNEQGRFFPLNYIYKASADTGEGSINITSTTSSNGYVQLKNGNPGPDKVTTDNMPLAPLLRDQSANSSF